MTQAQPSASEESFHDAWGRAIEPDDVPVDAAFEACTAPENRQILEVLGDVAGKKVLDLGCGAGEAAVYLAKHGALVTAADASEQMLAVTRAVAAVHGVSVTTRRWHADALQCEDDTFDVVYASNLLHHVAIEPTLRESARVLKKGGTFVSWDPIPGNPLIHVYRRIATKVRTPTEHPLTKADLQLFATCFGSVTYRMTWLFCLLIFVYFYLIERVHPNEQRYWKKVIMERERLRRTYTTLEKIDRICLKLLPFLKWWCWNVTVVATK